MAAVFPNTKKTFSQIVDGTTYMEAVNVNVVYNEVEAVQTFIGAIGRTQANSDSLKNLLADYASGAEVRYNSTTQVTVNAGCLMISDAGGNRGLRRNTSAVTVTWGMIDTGAEANSTTYYIYAVADASGTAFTIMVSTNASTPTGATFYRKIGAFYNDSGGNIEGVTDLVNKRYESGWLVVAAATSYTRTHNLGVQPMQIEVLHSTDTSGTAMQRVGDTANSGAATYTDGCIIQAITTTQMTIKAGGRSVITSGFTWGGDAISAITNGYYKIVAHSL